MLVRPRVPRRRLVGAVSALALGAGLLVLPALSAPAAAADPCGPGGNKISCENSKPGTDPDVWDIAGAGDPEIQGFATDISVNVGQTVRFKIDTTASAYSIDIYRMGYYQGDGARKITSVTPSASLPQIQPTCITDTATDNYDCGNWGVSASWAVPSTAVSGVYIAHLRRATGDGSHITFIVRDDASHSDVVFQTADPTWHAYNTYGGAFFYGGGSHGRAYKVSYNRPFLTRGRESGRDFFMSAEYAMVRFIERNGYDVSYIAGVDTDRRGQLLTNHKVFLSVGHDEYWSKAQRAAVEAARDAGVHLQFLAGNEVYWKTRYEPSIDGSNTDHRTLVSYKETWSGAKIDPSEEWTGTFRDPRFAPVSRGGGTPENALVGTQYMVNFSDLALRVNADEGKLRLWRHTELASLPAGSSRALAPHTIGYESNEDVDNGHRPAGLIRLSTTTGPVPEYLQDFGNTVAPGETTHHLTLYKAASGALVFSAGTVQWAWGLDEVHDSGWAPEPADPRMQQAQVNLFADMEAQPTTLASHLVAATRTTDTAAPVVAINSPAAGSAMQNGQMVTVTGTASDTGGRVAGVEVSVDGGQTWHAADGTTSWSHTYRQLGQGASQVRARAMDDSANIGSPATRSFNVSCPCSIFGNEQPALPATDDTSANELGVRFVALADGFVDGVRFYKGPGNAGTHVGSLWAGNGERLAQATFTGETATGWQQVTFATPVAVAAGQTYLASYTAPQGRYAMQEWAFAAGPKESGALMVEGGFGAPAGGRYGSPGTFPTGSHHNANYFVDVLFSTTSAAPLIALGHWPLPGSTSVPAQSTITAKYSKPLTAGSAGVTVKDSNGATVPGTTEYDAVTRTITFTPSAPLAGGVEHTVTLSGTDTSGNQVTTGGTWTFTTVRPPGQPGVCPCTLFDDGTVPTVLEDADREPVTLGVRFTPQTHGRVTGVRFYKGVNNTGSHVGTLWGPDGTELARGTFTDESPTGWQTLTFDAPVDVRRDTTYVAAYRAPGGRYSATPNAFALADLSRPPLSVSAAAGAYTYGAGFPATSSPTSYLVDVVFEKVAPSIAIEGRQPADGAVSVPRGSRIVVDLSAPVVSGWEIAVHHGTTSLPGSATLNAAGTRIIWTAAERLPADAQVDVLLSGVVSVDGAVLGEQGWTFRTRATEPSGEQTLFGDLVPDHEAEADAAPVEVGVVLEPTRNGFITALRFYKGAGNLGTHRGSLWSATGTRLAEVMFVGETESGWQTAQLTAPVAVTAGERYVASYLAPQGHYSYSTGFFSQPWESGDLRAPQGSNGRFLYGASGGFPTYSWDAANYFVDVVFEREPASLDVTSRTPEPGAEGVALSATPTLELSAPLAQGATISLSSAGQPVAGASAVSADGRSLVFTPAGSLVEDAEHVVTVSGLVSTDGATLAPQSWTFRTREDVSSLLEGLVPVNPSVNDGDAVELGTAFTPSVDGAVTAVRFYKGAGNGGVHTGSLWSADGSRLATVTFSSETASGWQQAAFTTPVTVTAGQEYVVSYYAPQGRYAASGGFFDTPRTVGPLTAPAGDNGRYRYGTGGGFPTGSWDSSNYFVDVVFKASP